MLLLLVVIFYIKFQTLQTAGRPDSQVLLTASKFQRKQHARVLLLFYLERRRPRLVCVAESRVRPIIKQNECPAASNGRQIPPPEANE